MTRTPTELRDIRRKNLKADRRIENFLIRRKEQEAGLKALRDSIDSDTIICIEDDAEAFRAGKGHAHYRVANTNRNLG